ncbi:hypothetical protein [Sphingopyxis lindanitolerans]
MGGGIVGLTAAELASRLSLRVILAEAGAIGSGVLAQRARCPADLVD